MPCVSRHPCLRWEGLIGWVRPGATYKAYEKLVLPVSRFIDSLPTPYRRASSDAASRRTWCTHVTETKTVSSIR